MFSTKQSNAIGTFYVLMSAACFSIGGILIKLIPWSSFSVNGIRSIFAFLIMIVYMRFTHHHFVINRTVFFGAICSALMTLSFVSATKLTTAANAIVLQFVHPVFLILIIWIVFKKKPDTSAIITCILVLLGILCFFLDKISSGSLIGNLLALFSGLTYAVMFILKKLEQSDFESSLIISYLLSFMIGIPSICNETQFSFSIWFCAILLGIIQSGLSYIFLSRGLDLVSPVTASLSSGIEPILNPLLVAIFYHESVGKLSILGSIIVIVSIMDYTLFQIKNQNNQITILEQKKEICR